MREDFELTNRDKREIACSFYFAADRRSPERLCGARVVCWTYMWCQSRISPSVPATRTTHSGCLSNKVIVLNS